MITRRSMLKRTLGALLGTVVAPETAIPVPADVCKPVYLDGLTRQVLLIAHSHLSALPRIYDLAVLEDRMNAVQAVQRGDIVHIRTPARFHIRTPARFDPS